MGRSFREFVNELTPKEIVIAPITKEDIEAYSNGELKYSWQDDE